MVFIPLRENFLPCCSRYVRNFINLLYMLQFLDDLDSSNFAKALGVMGFEGATKGTFKHGMKKQVCCITVGSIFKNVEMKVIYIRYLEYNRVLQS